MKKNQLFEPAPLSNEIKEQTLPKLDSSFFWAVSHINPHVANSRYNFMSLFNIYYLK